MNSPYLRVEQASLLPTSARSSWQHSAKVEQFVNTQLAERTARELTVQVLDVHHHARQGTDTGGLLPTRQQLRIAVKSSPLEDADR